MSDYKVYVLVLCIIVYVALTALFSVLITVITKQSLKLVRLGVEDDKIKTEYFKTKNKKRSTLMGIIDAVIPIVCCAIVVFLFVSSFVVSCTENNVVGSVPAVKVVTSTSMSKKEEKNEYLTENGLDNQLQMYDVILTHKLPGEFELKKYDIVVYEVDDGILLVHRIVNIEEPNEKHPGERWFQLQGDAVPNPDKFPVKYEQMKSIYRGERVPFVGTFIMFLQSTAGMLCVLLMVFTAVVTPILEKKFKKEYNLRLQAMGVLDENLNYIEPATEEPDIASEETSLTLDDIAPTEEVCEEPEVEPVQEESVIAPNLFANFNKGKNLSYRQKIQALAEVMQERYKKVCHYALKYESVHFGESKRYFTLTVKRLPLARFFVRGKTVCVCLALNPANYDAIEFGITPSPSGKAREEYPTQIKLTSNLKAKKACLLLEEAFKPYIKNGALKTDKLRAEMVSDYDLCLKNATLHEEEVVLEADVFEERRKISFSERIRNSSAEIKSRYKRVMLALMPTEKAKSRISSTRQTVKVGNTPVAKLTVRGKTLCLYLSVTPSEYSHVKGLLTDVTAVKAHGDYGALIKLTSERRLKNAIAIINEKYNSLIESGKLKQKDFATVADFGFLADLGVKLGFKERLSLASEEVKLYYQEIISLLQDNGTTIRESNNYVTAKIKSKKVAKIALRGKTLRVYLALNPIDYENTKYKFTNALGVKSHEGYPMLIKITSKRKQKHLKELISSLTK